MYPDNILLWPDGFWCFREEHSPSFLRQENYRVIEHYTDEWRDMESGGILCDKKAAG